MSKGQENTAYKEKPMVFQIPISTTQPISQDNSSVITKPKNVPGLFDFSAKGYCACFWLSWLSWIVGSTGGLSGYFLAKRLKEPAPLLKEI